jgi:hypothetical protein
LVDDYWDDDYHDPALNVAVEEILKEWQKLTGSTFYDDMYYLIDLKIYDDIRIEALQTMSLVFPYVDLLNKAYAAIPEDKELDKLKEFYTDTINDLIKSFKFPKFQKVEDILQKIKQIEQKKEEQEKEEKKKEKEIQFEDLITPIEIQFKINIDTDITCAKYISYYNRLKVVNNG